MYGYPENKRGSLPVFSVIDDRWPNGGKLDIHAILEEERTYAGQDK